MKKIISLTLTFLMLLSLSAVSYAAPVRASDESTVAQLKLIASEFGNFRQDEAAADWKYTTTDLDHNGRLELIAASEQGPNKYTFVKLWEMTEDESALKECSVLLPEDESFPDILTENADTVYDPTNDSWTYMFYDNIVLGENEAYYAKCTVSFLNSELSFRQLAVQHTLVSGGGANTTYMDNNGSVISAEQYNNAGAPASAEAIKSSTNFDWIAASDISEERLNDSYAVFKGVKQPPEKADQTTIPTPEPTPAPTFFMTITKNPTNESRVVGGTAWFVSGASGYTSLEWTFAAPNGGEYSVQSFRNMFPTCTVNGENSTTLTVGNLNMELSGWGVFCTFYNNGQTARTNTAYMYVSAAQAVQPAQTQTQTQTVTYYPSYYSSYYGENVYDFGDGTYLVENGDGSSTYYDNNDGSWTDFSGNYSSQHFSDGSTFTDFGDGSYLVDNGFGTATYIDGNSVEDIHYIPEIYSDYYGWGSYVW